MYVNKKASVKIFENEIVNLISMDNNDENNSFTLRCVGKKKRYCDSDCEYWINVG